MVDYLQLKISANDRLNFCGGNFLPKKRSGYARLVPWPVITGPLTIKNIYDKRPKMALQVPFLGAY